MIPIFLKGAIMGFSIAAPVGPIGVLCIQRTLSRGMLSGFVSGLGAATADGFYGMIAAVGLSSISSILISGQALLRGGGGAFLVYLGIKAFRSGSSRVKVPESGSASGTLLRAYLSTFALTITNPMTIITFTAIFTGLGIGSSIGGIARASAMAFGFFCGSAAWWLVLSGISGFLRTKVKDAMMPVINKVSGTVIIAFGLLAIILLKNI